MRKLTEVLATYIALNIKNSETEEFIVECLGKKYKFNISNDFGKQAISCFKVNSNNKEIYIGKISNDLTVYPWVAVLPEDMDTVLDFVNRLMLTERLKSELKVNEVKPIKRIKI